jgi:hypothetical protein
MCVERERVFGGGFGQQPDGDGVAELQVGVCGREDDLPVRRGEHGAEQRMGEPGDVDGAIGIVPAAGEAD